MANLIKAACAQMTSGPDMAANLTQAETMIRSAAEQGATFVATPEVTDRMLPKKPENIGKALTEDQHPGIAHFAALAKDLGIWLLIGSMSIRISDTQIDNRTFLFAPDGRLASTYNKIHLYDVDLPTGESHRESNTVQSGSKAVIADCAGAKLGMSICYDVRFPHFFRDLAKSGAQIITVPAAFTMPTGQAHWETLLRARAIETGCFILAPAQTGDHGHNRQTWGHSVIINPWGEVIAKAGAEPEIIFADLDLAQVDKARHAVPSLKHDRDYEVP